MKYLCPGCDREVRVGSTCPRCAKKKRPTAKKTPRSWEQDQAVDGLDFADDDFDYDSFVQSEFGNSPKTGIRWYWVVVALILLLGMAAGIFLRG